VTVKSSPARARRRASGDQIHLWSRAICRDLDGGRACPSSSRHQLHRIRADHLVPARIPTSAARRPLQRQDRPLAGSTASAMLYNIAKQYNLDDKKLQAVNLPRRANSPRSLGNVQAMRAGSPGPQRRESGGELIHTVHDHFEMNRDKRAGLDAFAVVASQSSCKTRSGTRLMSAGPRPEYAADPATRRGARFVARETKQRCWSRHLGQYSSSAFDELTFRHAQHGHYSSHPDA